MTCDHTAAELRAYLRGWDDALNCHDETMSWVPDEHLVAVTRMRAARRSQENSEKPT